MNMIWRFILSACGNASEIAELNADFSEGNSATVAEELITDQEAEVLRETISEKGR